MEATLLRSSYFAEASQDRSSYEGRAPFAKASEVKTHFAEACYFAEAT